MKIDNIVFNQIIEKLFGHFTIKSITIFFFILCDQQTTETSTMATSAVEVSTSTAKVSLSVTTTVKSQFQCQFYQIPIGFKCDGTTHCVPDGTDERDCPEAPVISSPISIPSIKAPTNHKELRVEFQKDKKTAWKSEKDVKELLLTNSYNGNYFF